MKNAHNKLIHVLLGFLCTGLILVSQPGCSGAVSNTDGAAPTPPPTKPQSSNRPDLFSEERDPEQDEGASEPEKISGAFLVCGDDVLSDAYGASDMDAPYGCAVLNEDPKKQHRCTAPKSIQLTTNASNAQTINTRAADTGSSWLFYFSAPYDEKLSLVEAEISCDGSMDLYSAKDKYLDYSMPLVKELIAGKAHLLFVTSEPVAGNAFGGLQGGDAKCQAAVINAGINAPQNGQFIALLSDASTSAKQRITGDKPVVNTAWQRVFAANKMWLDVSSPNPSVSLENQIMTEGGGATNGPVWTGTAPTGESYFQIISPIDPTNAGKTNCNNWKSAGIADRSAIGDPNAKNGHWISRIPHQLPPVTSPSNVHDCRLKAHIYCINQ